MIRDRGHKKWVSLMLPEHKDRLQKWAYAQDDVTMPTLDEDQLQEFNHRISVSLQDGRIVEVIYYSNKRFVCIQGVIKRCDPLAGYLLLEEPSGELFRIRLALIKEIHLQ
ncbi:YolD-like family protein [Paenibacillus jiagnxiensis]|uniref:YolD-like family protein n=1 Tax=Paenibacillus jiagnxiensis TaxID=3228926 RepID=UPI0033AF56AC